MSMRSLGGRKLVAAAIVLAVGGIPAIVTSQGAGLFSSSPAAASTAPPPDRLVYAQTTGHGGTYISYFPGGSTKASSTESFTSAGGCATPSASGPTLMSLSAFLYPSNTDGSYGPEGSQAPAIMTQDKQKTGVCALGQSWSIDNVPPNSAPQTGAEALTFSLAGSQFAGRILQEASIDLQRSDKLTQNVVVQLLESTSTNSSAPIYTQCYSIAPSYSITGGGLTYTADTKTYSDPNAVCANDSPPSAGFDTLQIRVLTPGGSVSVVGPTSTFTFAGQICAGNSMTTYSSTDPTFGKVTFTVTDNATAGCKTYTGFTAFQAPPTSTSPQPSKTAEFDTLGTGTNTFDFTFTIDWGNFVQCTPLTCPVTQVSYNGGGYIDQTYCAGATSTQPLCTTSKTYTYVTAPNPDPSTGNGTYTDIQETWDGLIDNSFRI